MATFVNQAFLTLNDTTVASNVATGTILDNLTLTKTALLGTYRADDTLTYVIRLQNAGAALTNLTVTDNLGAYAFGATTLYPLTYLAGSVNAYQNGTPVPAPTVVYDGGALQFTGVDVPAGGNTLLVYSVKTNAYAPLNEGASVTNTATATRATQESLALDSETVYAVSESSLNLIKTISPNPVTPEGTLTYTLTIENFGNLAVVATDNAVITDTLNPILQNLSVTFNGGAWSEGVDYTYDETSGLFQTTPNGLTVPAATYTQDPTSGEWTLTPGTSTLILTGNL